LGFAETDDDYSTRWSNIKRYFSIACVGIKTDTSKSRQAKREKPVWQNRFWEHTIKSERDRQNHADYIHYNPVKHGLVISPGDWPYSSFGRCVNKGWYDENWGKGEPENIKGMDFE
jgi:putative transposase